MLEAAIGALEPKVNQLLKSANVNLEALKRGPGAVPPEGASLFLACESATEFASLSPDGLAGQSCALGDGDAKPEAGGTPVPVWRRGPMTFSLWVRPEGEGSGPLLSTMDYATNPASTATEKASNSGWRPVSWSSDGRTVSRHTPFGSDRRVRESARASGRMSLSCTGA